MYCYIDHCQCVNKAVKPPFEPPIFGLLNVVGLILTYAEHPTNSGPFSGKSNAGSLSPMCLTEEVILSMGEEGTGGFTKFIHNANATI